MESTVVIKKYITLTEGRMVKVWLRWRYMAQGNETSFGSMYHSKRYQREKLHCQRLEAHGHWLMRRFLKKNGIPWAQYEVEIKFTHPIDRTIGKINIHCLQEHAHA